MVAGIDIGLSGCKTHMSLPPLPLLKEDPLPCGGTVRKLLLRTVKSYKSLWRKHRTSKVAQIKVSDTEGFTLKRQLQLEGKSFVRILEGSNNLL